MELMMKAIALCVVAWMLVGCNTMEGLGKDIKKGGEAIEKAASK
jgi:predicted small secreted protein